MVWFSERKELEKQYYEWIKENGIADQPNSMIAFLEINGLLKDEKVHEKAGIAKPKPRTNFDKIAENEGTLADFLGKIMICDDCPVRLQYNTCKCSASSPCPQIIKEWLQKECE